MAIQKPKTVRHDYSKNKNLTLYTVLRSAFGSEIGSGGKAAATCSTSAPASRAPRIHAAAFRGQTRVDQLQHFDHSKSLVNVCCLDSVDANVQEWSSGTQGNKKGTFNARASFCDCEIVAVHITCQIRSSVAHSSNCVSKDLMSVSSLTAASSYRPR